jgi:hypothetical protein
MPKMRLLLLAAAAVLVGACADVTGPPPNVANRADSTSSVSAPSAGRSLPVAQLEADPDYALSW